MQNEHKKYSFILKGTDLSIEVLLKGVIFTIKKM